MPNTTPEDVVNNTDVSTVRQGGIVNSFDFDFLKLNLKISFFLHVSTITLNLFSSHVV